MIYGQSKSDFIYPNLNLKKKQTINPIVFSISKTRLVKTKEGRFIF